MATRESLHGVQYVRAIAALSVAYYHCAIQVPSLTPYFSQGLGGSLNLPAGVDVFFVISGFIMYVTGRHLAPWQFLARRLARIVPLYWFLTILVAAVLFVRPELFRTTVVSVPYLLKSLLFIPYSNPAHGGDFMPILVPGWSLNMEMFFYVVFAGLLAIPSWPLIRTATAVFLGLWALNQALDPAGSLPVVRYLTGLRDFEFLAGLWIGHLYVTDRMRAPKGILVLLLAGSVCALLWPVSTYTATPLGFLAFSLAPATALVGTVVLWERRFGMKKLRFLSFLGDASYSLYLSHILSLGVARVVWARMGPDSPSVLAAAGFAVLATLLVLAGSVTAYLLVERPLTRYFHRPRASTPAVRSASA